VGSHISQWVVTVTVSSLVDYHSSH